MDKKSKIWKNLSNIFENKAADKILKGEKE
jgi:hypothetical protein